jgi:hypothetical protein
MVYKNEIKLKKGRSDSGYGHYVILNYRGVSVIIVDDRTTFPIGQNHLQQIGECVLDEMFGDLYESKKERKKYVENNGIKVDFDVGEE